MFAASVFATYKSYKAGELTGVDHQLIIDTVIGFLVSMVVAFFVVKWLLRFVQSHTFNGFATYRVILGGGLLIALYTHAIPDISNEEAAPTTPATRPHVTMTDSGPTPVQSDATPLKEAQLPMLNSTNPASWTPASMQDSTNTAPAAPINEAPATNVESAPIAPGTAPTQ